MLTKTYTQILSDVYHVPTVHYTYIYNVFIMVDLCQNAYIYKPLNTHVLSFVYLIHSALADAIIYA